MDPKAKSRYQAKAKIIKAMSHPTRLFMVDELSKGERCVCELTEMVGDDISTISKHLSILKNAGIVSDEKRGTQVFYSLRHTCLLDLFSSVDLVLKTNVKKQVGLVR